MTIQEMGHYLVTGSMMGEIEGLVIIVKEKSKSLWQETIGSVTDLEAIGMLEIAKSNIVNCNFSLSEIDGIPTEGDDENV